MKFDIVRAWKDESYRQSLNEEQRSSLPANPAGELELTSTDLETVYGGGTPGGGTPTGIPGLPYIPGMSKQDAALAAEFLHSIAIFCQELEFSITIVKSVHVASPITVICVNETLL
jgi:mersacidin/lichenicidin family type 2 lantibiotic